MFESIIGNAPIKAYLTKAIRGETLPHALLFAGPDGVGKSLFAKELAGSLLKDADRTEKETHPDFHVIKPEGKSGLHAIETLRQLIDRVHEAPFEAPCKVFLIHDAHRMQPAAANALLKTLEEPSPGTVLILLTSALQEILPTISSRCSVLRFLPLSEGEIAGVLKAKGLPEQLAKRSHGSIGIACDLAARASIDDLLFELLAEKGKFYPERMRSLEKIEKEMEHEDPVKYSENVHHLLSHVLMWHRDQIARQYGAALLVPEAPQATVPLPSLAEMERRVDEAKLAFSRNMRLAVCFEKLFGV